MRNGATRGKYRKDLHALCFMTETAGGEGTGAVGSESVEWGCDFGRREGCASGALTGERGDEFLIEDIGGKIRFGDYIQGQYTVPEVIVGDRERTKIEQSKR